VRKKCVIQNIETHNNNGEGMGDLLARGQKSKLGPLLCRSSWGGIGVEGGGEHASKTKMGKGGKGDLSLQKKTLLAA